MILCRVIGSAVPSNTSRHTNDEGRVSGRPLLIVQPVDAEGRRLGGELVAEARVRTTVGDLVLVDPDRRSHGTSVPVAAIQAVAVAVVEGLSDRTRSSL